MEEVVLQETVLEKVDAMLVGMLIVSDQSEDGDTAGVLKDIGEDRVNQFFNMMIETNKADGFGTPEDQKKLVFELLDNILKQLGI